MSEADSNQDVLSAPYRLAYRYKRTLGPVMSRYFTGLRDGTIWGIRTPSGQVYSPPVEVDPKTSASVDLSEESWVELSSLGTVETFSWVVQPRQKHPLDRPFAWAMVVLDGADTPMLHAVDGGSLDAMHKGMRVRVRWAEERLGTIQDIACFEPLPEGEGPNVAAAVEAESPVTRQKAPVQLDYTITAGREQSRFLRAMTERVILGCKSVDGKVYVPPTGGCPVSGLPTVEDVTVAETGTVTTFCVVNFPFEGQVLEPPYVFGAVILDGADIPLFHLIGGCPADEVRMGMRVRAKWVEDDKLDYTLASILYFEPSGEEDAEYDAYREHL